MFADIELIEEDGQPVVLVRGELDLASAGQLRELLAEAVRRGAAELVVDLSGATFVDSSGLGVIVGASGRRDGSPFPHVVVRGASTAVRRVFEVAGLGWLLDDARAERDGPPA